MEHSVLQGMGDETRTSRFATPSYAISDGETEAQRGEATCLSLLQLVRCWLLAMVHKDRCA